MWLGVHCSISGGINNAISEARKLGINAMQVFTKNQRQWQEKTFTEDESGLFRQGMAEAGIKIAFSHSTYLINLASENPETRIKSKAALIGEIKRCAALGLPYTVLHPGSNPVVSEAEAITMIIEALNEVFSETSELPVRVLLENTAGQGKSIGWKFEHLGDLLSGLPAERTSICFDTCHALVAGHEFRNPVEFERMWSSFDRIIGLDKLKAIHLNDSKGDLGSRLDRHEHIGQGKLGLETFRLMLKRFSHLPMVMETRKENEMDAVNLATLRKLLD
jgi:deoxyribonuclease-4